MPDTSPSSGPGTAAEIHARLRDGIGAVAAYFEKERDLAREGGWGNFSEAKGNMYWVHAFQRALDRAAETWEGDGASFARRALSLFDEVEPDDDYKWPTDARRRVKALLERAAGEPAS